MSSQTDSSKAPQNTTNTGQNDQQSKPSQQSENASQIQSNTKDATPSKPSQQSKGNTPKDQATDQTQPAAKSAPSNTSQPAGPPTDPTAALQSAFAAVTGQTSAKINELSPGTQEKVSNLIYSITGGKSPAQLAKDIPPETKEQISNTLTSFDPRNPESRHALVNMVTTSVTWFTGKLPLPEGLGDQLKDELNKATSSGDFFLDQAVSMVSDSVSSWVENAQTDRPNPEKPLGDIEKHAKDNTVISALGGTLGGLTRTLGGTVGALGGGVGDTVTNVGPQGQQHVKQEGGAEGEDQAEGEGGEQAPKTGVGASISGTGQSITDWSNWTARAMENTTKGYPVQWQDITGNDKRI